MTTRSLIKEVRRLKKIVYTKSALQKSAVKRIFDKDGRLIRTELAPYPSYKDSPPGLIINYNYENPNDQDESNTPEISEDV